MCNKCVAFDFAFIFSIWQTPDLFALSIFVSHVFIKMAVAQVVQVSMQHGPVCMLTVLVHWTMSVKQCKLLWVGRKHYITNIFP